jgi:hypothetical protein
MVSATGGEFTGRYGAPPNHWAPYSTVLAGAGAGTRIGARTSGTKLTLTG